MEVGIEREGGGDNLCDKGVCGVRLSLAPHSLSADRWMRTAIIIVWIIFLLLSLEVSCTRACVCVCVFNLFYNVLFLDHSIPRLTFFFLYCFVIVVAVVVFWGGGYFSNFFPLRPPSPTLLLLFYLSLYQCLCTPACVYFLSVALPLFLALSYSLSLSPCVSMCVNGLTLISLILQ